MTSVLHEHDGYFENVTVELDASETLVFTRALVKFAEDDSEHSIDRLVATRMVRDLQKIADAPQTESTGSPIGDYRDGVGAWQTDCGWGEPNE